MACLYNSEPPKFESFHALKDKCFRWTEIKSYKKDRKLRDKMFLKYSIKNVIKYQRDMRKFDQNHTSGVELGTKIIFSAFFII